ncbi:hypothetical protein Moror_16714 [Moniliophthora roreri MCA 2997]|uniref:Uncharacterized protein n=2 Tax=Moniliophthora roreri TaxID=221103 RepID=V2WMA2_MONRO|nr:hypothetical protein Moror_16714 [Moniliophthora roreri MCA 2997]
MPPTTYESSTSLILNWFKGLWDALTECEHCAHASALVEKELEELHLGEPILDDDNIPDLLDSNDSDTESLFGDESESDREDRTEDAMMVDVGPISSTITTVNSVVEKTKTASLPAAYQKTVKELAQNISADT